MTDSIAAAVLQAHPDPFASQREAAEQFRQQHGSVGALPTYIEARELAVMIAAVRASYVCMLFSGFGYAVLHVASAFRHTGRLDVVESDPVAAEFVERMVTQASLNDRVRVNLGAHSSVVGSLNGPYDAIVADDTGTRYLPLFDDVVRLTRTGGCIIVQTLGEEGPSTEGGLESNSLLGSLVNDPRMFTSVPRTLNPIISVRRR
jgi:predicted O-methyltransferase YrrM